MDFSEIRGIIFDLDGTLADTVPAIAHAMNLTMAHFGYPSRTNDEICRAIGNGARKLVARSMPAEAAENGEQVSRVLAHYDATYATTYMETDVCYAGMREAVTELARRGYRISVLSNKQDPYVQGLVAQLLPAGVVSCTLGQGPLPTKPDPAAPRFLMEKMELSPDRCLMVGDSQVDIDTARNAAMAGVVGCAWGFRGRTALEEGGADAVVDRPEELLTILKGVKER